MVDDALDGAGVGRGTLTDASTTWRHDSAGRQDGGPPGGSNPEPAD